MLRGKDGNALLAFDVGHDTVSKYKTRGSGNVAWGGKQCLTFIIIIIV